MIEPFRGRGLGVNKYKLFVCFKYFNAKLEVYFESKNKKNIWE